MAKETPSSTKETAVKDTATLTLVAPTERRALDKEMRPLYQKIAYLSAILGIARKACYDSTPEKAAEALETLEMELPATRKLAALLVPYDS